jgi:hypothetical protein
MRGRRCVLLRYRRSASQALDRVRPRRRRMRRAGTLWERSALWQASCPPGTYFIDVNYYYSGDARGSAALGVALRDREIGGISLQADLKIEAEAMLALAPLFLWVGKMSAAILMSLLR